MQKECKKCNKIKNLSLFYKNKNSKDGLTKKCIDCTKLERKQWYLLDTNRKKVNDRKKKWRQTPKGRYCKYKEKAQYRKIGWDLTYKQFMQFWQKDCYYCGSKIKTIGLDRINNKKGYKTNNVFSCCTDCNKFKREYSFHYFISKCKKINKNFS